MAARRTTEPAPADQTTTDDQAQPDDAPVSAPVLAEHQQLPNVHQAMAHAMRLLRAVGKWGTNREQGYSFRSIDHLMTALKPAMAEAGVHVVPRVLQRLTDESHQTKGGAIMRWVDVEMAFTFYGPDGSCVEAVTWGEARDAADKATNKAMTGAFKYAVLQTFMVPTDDLVDADADSPEAQPPAQASPEEREAERARVQGLATADPATVEGYRQRVLDATATHPPGPERDAVLLPIYHAAGTSEALGCQVTVPVAWRREDGPTAVALHQLIAGAREVTAWHGEGQENTDPWADGSDPAGDPA